MLPSQVPNIMDAHIKMATRKHNTVLSFRYRLLLVILMLEMHKMPIPVVAKFEALRGSLPTRTPGS
jgi:hypothetical protein